MSFSFGKQLHFFHLVIIERQYIFLSQGRDHYLLHTNPPEVTRIVDIDTYSLRLPYTRVKNLMKLFTYVCIIFKSCEESA